MKDGFLSSVEYKKILGSVPVVCVDLLIRHQKEFLLVKRNHKPAKGKLWIPGGRVLKKETFKKAIFRKLQEDAGISPKSIIRILPLPTGETFFKTSEFGVSTHTINVTFLVDVREKNTKTFGIDGKIFWFEKPPASVSSYVKKYISLVRSKKIYAL